MHFSKPADGNDIPRHAASQKLTELSKEVGNRPVFAEEPEDMPHPE
jgi:hypothetical protein